jgi:hypothetical protein
MKDWKHERAGMDRKICQLALSECLTQKPGHKIRNRLAPSAVIGGIYGAEVCLSLAIAIFAAQALVILVAPAVSLAGQSRRW